ncbi:hypothetical protein BV898_14754 [Hypsibius exemplaris]|uniref:Protein quiver n=1 Tax=Hypsibius exemplaris TaxID=2072580 RepID=A0A9X6NGH5_HYPEX|nr:hypothetical protein BV898_14754 [Hypsibius exemplaris]
MLALTISWNLSILFAGTSALVCYHCKVDSTGSSGIVRPCPDVADLRTTEARSCPEGACLTFSGKQEWRGKSVEGILRLCLTDSVTKVVYPPDWTGRAKALTCESVTTSTVRNQTSLDGQPCDPTQLGSLTLTGQACLCNSDRCNSGAATNSAQSAMNPASFSSWLLLFLLIFVLVNRMEELCRLCAAYF